METPWFQNLKCWVRYSASVADGDRPAFFRFVELAKDFLSVRWLRFWNAHVHSDVAFQYSSDSTPASVRKRVTRWLTFFEVTRSNKETCHFLVEKAFGVSGNQMAYLFSEPTEILDTGVDTHFARYRKFVRLPIEIGHMGGNVNGFVLDGALKSAFEKRNNQLVRALEMGLEEKMGEGQAFLLACLSLWVYITCFSHITHTAFKRSVSDYISNAAIMRSAWICFESLRNSGGVLTRHFRPWYAEVLAFADSDSGVCMETWALVGLAGIWLHLAVTLRLRWKDGRLWEAARFEGSPHLCSVVEMLCVHIWTFKTWSESRWAHMTPCTRTMLALA